jgi:hypothetical protein
MVSLHPFISSCVGCRLLLWKFPAKWTPLCWEVYAPELPCVLWVSVWLGERHHGLAMWPHNAPGVLTWHAHSCSILLPNMFQVCLWHVQCLGTNWPRDSSNSDARVTCQQEGMDTMQWLWCLKWSYVPHCGTQVHKLQLLQYSTHKGTTELRELIIIIIWMRILLWFIHLILPPPAFAAVHQQENLLCLQPSPSHFNKKNFGKPMRKRWTQFAFSQFASDYPRHFWWEAQNAKLLVV